MLKDVFNYKQRENDLRQLERDIRKARRAAVKARRLTDKATRITGEAIKAGYVADDIAREALGTFYDSTSRIIDVEYVEAANEPSALAFSTTPDLPRISTKDSWQSWFAMVDAEIAEEIAAETESED